MDILIATYNHKKRQEIKMLLKDFSSVNVMGFDDLEITPPIIVEDGKTFRQNAVKKAVTMSRFFNGLVLADDSGLEVDALGGRPGVRSARFARSKATDTENNEKLLKLLKDVPEKGREAKFVCHIALAKEGTLLGNFEGTIKGKVIFKQKGKKGFGYDPVFLPDGYKKTFAQMSTNCKNKISHRGLALEKFKKFIATHLKSK